MVAIDSQSSTYRITFDRPGLGSHSVPDIEILANDYAEMLPLASLLANRGGGMQQRGGRQQPNGSSVHGSGGSGSARKLAAAAASRNDPLLGSEIFNNSKLRALVGDDDGGGGGGGSGAASSVTSLEPTVGGFHLKLLELIIRTRKTLAAKEMKLKRLREMNDEAAMLRSFMEPLPEDFQRRYASVVIGMEKLNRDMQVSFCERTPQPQCELHSILIDVSPLRNTSAKSRATPAI